MTKLGALCAGTCACIVVGCATPSGPSRCSSAGHAHATSDRSPTGGDAYHGLIQYRAKDAKPAIMEPTLIAAKDALFVGGTKVIGVYVNGVARAYPLFMLSNHQVVNDVVGGIPLSATW